VQADIIKFLEGYSLDASFDPIHLGLRADGRIDGDCLVAMATEEEVRHLRAVAEG
jgi:hypothetical protein